MRFEPKMGLAIALATISTVICAALIGMFIPLTLNRLNVDPAVATGPFVTTTIDLLAILIYFSTCVVVLGSITFSTFEPSRALSICSTIHRPNRQINQG